MIEFQLAQALHRHPAFVFKAFEVKFTAGRTAASRKTAAQRRRDEERDRCNNQNRRDIVRHVSDPVAQVAFEPAPQFRIEVAGRPVRAGQGRISRL